MAIGFPAIAYAAIGKKYGCDTCEGRSAAYDQQIYLPIAALALALCAVVLVMGRRTYASMLVSAASGLLYAAWLAWLFLFWPD